MKKLLVLLLALVMALSLAACGDKDDEGGYEVTPTDLKENDTTNDGPSVGLDENQSLLEDFAAAEAAIGAAIVWPEDMPYSLIVQDSDEQVTIEFTYNDVDFTGRWHAGEKEDLSSLSGMSFANSETQNLSGVDMELRWQKEGISHAMGVAEGYSAAKNVSFMVVQNDGATTGDLLAEVTEKFVATVQ